MHYSKDSQRIALTSVAVFARPARVADLFATGAAVVVAKVVIASGALVGARVAKVVLLAEDSVGEVQ